MKNSAYRFKCPVIIILPIGLHVVLSVIIYTEIQLKSAKNTPIRPPVRPPVTISDFGDFINDGYPPQKRKNAKLTFLAKTNNTR